MFVITYTNGQDVKIGTQIWSTQNLNVTHYRNGDPIPEVTDENKWASLTTGAWCHYNNDSSYDAKYGKLYNWFAVSDPRGLAPKGYHIPTFEELTQLIDILGGDAKAGPKLLSKTGCPANCIGTNESGFNGFLTGYRSPYGVFKYLDEFGSVWSSTEDNLYNAWYIQLNCDLANVPSAANSKIIGLAVRCISDATAEPTLQNASIATLVYFATKDENNVLGKEVLTAKMENGNIYYNMSKEGAPNWKLFMKYDVAGNILDLDEVAVMKYSGNELKCLSGSYTLGQERTETYTRGFNLIDTIANAQFCGGQKFIIQSAGVSSQKQNLYSVKMPANYFYEYSYNDLLKKNPKIIFSIKNQKSRKLDFAVIFLMLKFVQNDIKPCE
jgi:uncharacterized protein (TIGR02145 family)